MKQMLVSELNATVRDNMLDQLLRAGYTFYPKWSVSLIIGGNRDHFRSASAINEWLRESGIAGYASASFLRVMLPDDDALAQYILRWSDDGQL